MFYWILHTVAWVILRIAFMVCGGIRYEGRENVPSSGAVLIAPNHISDADPPAIGMAAPRGCWFMAKEELFSIRILGPLIRAMRGFPVRPHTADRAALRRAEELLSAGEAVVIFPEGKLSEDGTLKEILPGFLLVAQRTGAPIVPTVIQGTDRIIPYGKLWPRPAFRTVVVRFGPPVTAQDLIGDIRGGEGLRRGAERLHALLLALQENRPYPPAAGRPRGLAAPRQEECVL